MGVLRQGEGREQCFPAAGRACRPVAVGEGGFVRPEGDGQLPGQGQRMDAVLAGAEVEQQEAGGCRLGGGGADQQAQAVFLLGLSDGHTALRAGGQLCPQSAAGEQEGPAHQRHQHQQPCQQRGPEGPPTFCVHSSASLQKTA